MREHFVDRQALNTTDLEYGAIRGMVSAPGDDGHTVFLPPEELASRQADLSGRFSGIGAHPRQARGVGIELPRGVLINQGSAGSADLLAGATQGHQHCS